MAPSCYYSVLGVAKTATDDEIRNAYKKMAVKWHPDKNPDNKQAHTRFQEISEAYQVLRDPTKRKHYDRYGRNGQEPAPSSRSRHASSRRAHEEFFYDDDPFVRHFKMSDFVFKDPMDIFNEVFRSHMFEMDNLFGLRSSQSRAQPGNLFRSPFGTFARFDSLFDDMEQSMLNLHTVSDRVFIENPNTKGFVHVASASYNSANPDGFVMTSESKSYENGRVVSKKKSYKNGVETVTIEEDGKVVSESIKDRPRTKYSRSIKGY